MPFFGRVLGGGGAARPKDTKAAAPVAAAEIELKQYVLVDQAVSDFEEIGVEEDHDDDGVSSIISSSSSIRDAFVVDGERFERVEKRDGDIHADLAAAENALAAAVQRTRMSQPSKRRGRGQNTSAPSAMTAPVLTGAAVPVASAGKKSEEGTGPVTPTGGSLAAQQATTSNNDGVPETADDESDWPLLNGTGYEPYRGIRPRPFIPRSIQLCDLRPNKPAGSAQSSDVLESLRSDFAGLSLGLADASEGKREDEEVLRMHRRALEKSLQASGRDHSAMLEAPTRPMPRAYGKSNTKDRSRAKSGRTSTTSPPSPSADASPHIPGLMMNDKPVSSRDVVRNARRLDERSRNLFDPITIERRILEARLLRSLGREQDADGKWQ